MKKETIAVTLLVLIIAAAALNTRRIESLTKQVGFYLSQSEEAAERGEFDEALRKFESALILWEGNRDYTNVFIRHPELDSSYDVFYELEEALLEGEAEVLPAAYSKLKYHMDCIAYMERPSWGSIF